MGQKQDAFCSLVEELLPLYQEHSIGEETERIIKEHLEECPSCREINRAAAKAYQQDRNRKKSNVSLSQQEQEERGKFRAVSQRLKRKKIRNICIGAVIIIGLCMEIIYLLAFQTVFQDGDSMSPTIQDGDYCLVSKISYQIHAPRRGDIVLLWMEKVPDLYRIVGIPGDEVEITDGHLLVNGKINRDYEGIRATVRDSVSREDYHITVPEGQYFFLGDHHELSYDSRDAGCVKREDIIGKFLTAKMPHFPSMVAHESVMAYDSGE